MTHSIDNLLKEIEKLHARNNLSQTISPEYFDPGMMEYLDKSDGIYEPKTGKIILRFEARGTRYEGRTEHIERMHQGDKITFVREPENIFNPNNFTLINAKGNNVGQMPAELCNAIAPLYDSGVLEIVDSFVSFVEPLTKRNRHARQSVLFVELQCKLIFYTCNC
jgi:hypothetical protein